jgi:hypothetical protein
MSQPAASTQNFGYRTEARKSEVTVTNPPQEAAVTRASLREYAAVQRERYQQASRSDKHRLLDEMVAVTGMHRKAAIRLLRRAPGVVVARPRSGRPRQYGPEVAAAAAVLWQASGRIGAHRLHPFVPELLDRLLQCGEVSLAPAVDKLVRQASRPTLARLLEGARAQFPRRGYDPAEQLAQAADSHPHLRRLGRCAARLLPGRSGRALRQQYERLLPAHPVCGRHGHQLD